ncbi:MAG: pirin family protein [Candidatus Neomarinimicrobiota bacterium]
MKKKAARSVKLLYDGEPVMDGAGVKITRMIGTRELNYIDPFLLLDQFKSENSDDYMAGFPNHPHRGFETVTYMIHGLSRHQDSMGYSGLLTQGSAQWMTAGKGVVHSEMPEPDQGLLWGYQLWVNLPAKLKMTEPRYQDIPSDNIPEFRQGGELVRIIAGEYSSLKGAAETLTDVLYFDVHLEANYNFTYDLENGKNGFIYVYRGSLNMDSKNVKKGILALLGSEGPIDLKSGPKGANFLFIAGAPLNEPIVRGGPFVMNTRGEIMQAFADFQ